MTARKRPAPAQENRPSHDNNDKAIVDPFSVPCDYCAALAGQQCCNLITDAPLARALAHPCRIRDAAEAVQR